MPPRRVPDRAWLIRQTWHDLLFLHWPVPALALRGRIPSTLQLDEYAGSAWVAVTPFWMSGIRFRHAPPLPIASRFDELNVRTYVRRGEREGAGVWFFSLDAGSRLAVLGARWLYRLPYVYARMKHSTEGEVVRYESERLDGTRFAARYQPTGPAALSQPGSLEYFLTERYCLYVTDRAGVLYRASIDHVPWPLQPAAVALARNDMLRVHGIPVEGPPATAHFARRLEVVVWSPELETPVEG